MMPATAETLHLELDDPAAFATLLGVRLPQDWPPGEYDRDAIQFFLEKMIEGGPEAVGWYGWYAILEGSEPALVGCGGYLGPPDESGCVEIGYSICERWRGQGLARGTSFMFWWTGHWRWARRRLWRKRPRRIQPPSRSCSDAVPAGDLVPSQSSCSLKLQLLIL